MLVLNQLFTIVEERYSISQQRQVNETKWSAEYFYHDRKKGHPVRILKSPVYTMVKSSVFLFTSQTLFLCIFKDSGFMVKWGLGANVIKLFMSVIYYFCIMLERF
jgi:hypothetical protein